MARAPRERRPCSPPTPRRASRPSTTSCTRSSPTGDHRGGAITHEAAAIAGRGRKLGNLVVIYDDKPDLHRGTTRSSPSPRTFGARYAAYGWHVAARRLGVTRRRLPRGPPGRCTTRSRRPRRSPTKAVVHSCCAPSSAWPAPTKQNTGGRARLRARATPKGWAGDQGDPRLRPGRQVPRGGRGAEPGRGEVAARGKALHAEWELAVRGVVGEGESRNGGRPLRPADLPLSSRTAGEGRPCRVFPADAKGTGTRRSSGKDPHRPGAVLPELWGGVGGTWPSPTTRRWRARPSFLPLNRQVRDVAGQPVRADAALRHPARHGHGAPSLNGITLSRPDPGLTGGTFPAVQ